MTSLGQYASSISRFLDSLRGFQFVLQQGGDLPPTPLKIRLKNEAVYKNAVFLILNYKTIVVLPTIPFKGSVDRFWFSMRLVKQNAGHDMAIVREPCNVGPHANILALFMGMLCPWLCVHIYCTHWLWLYSCLSFLTDRNIAFIQGTPPHTTHHTPHITHTESNVELGFPD